MNLCARRWRDDEKLEGTPETEIVQLAAIDGVTLTPLLQGALNSGTVEALPWDYEQVYGGAGAPSHSIVPNGLCSVDVREPIFTSKLA
jgi:hypothetical protein